MNKNLLKSFYFVVVLLFTLLTIAPGLAQEPEQPIVGAIRWDGWFAGGDYERFLAPKQWHNRLPFYSKVISEEKVEVRSDSQKIMDKEICYAKEAGLDYWAFVYYYPTSWPGADSYNYGLKLYLSSKHQNDFKFCLTLQGWHLGPKEKWPQTTQSFVKLFKEPTYQTVLDGRPLIYIFYVPKMIELFGSESEAREAIDTLRKKTIKAGLKNPYMVAQVFDANEGCNYISNLGFDALSAYSIFGYGPHQQYPVIKNDPDRAKTREIIGKEYSYKTLMQINRDFWNACKTKGKKTVPIVNAGWDWRPRLVDKEIAGKYGKHSLHWFAQPTPGELGDHLKSALDWTIENHENAEAQALLIYAWNESDEGGWLVPTITEGTARLEAIKKVLKNNNCTK